MSDVTLYQLPLSPNNVKVRIALAYKGIPYESVEVAYDDPERRRLVELSGQPLTPVLAHGDRVISDSAAIMRYLEANFPGTPKILFAERSQMSEAEALEKWIKTQINEPVGMAFGQVMSETPDLSVCRRASELMHERTATLEERLADSDWLVGDALSFVDITAAPFVIYAMLPERAAALHPAAAFLREHLTLGEGRERTRAWCRRVIAYDPMLRD